MNRLKVLMLGWELAPMISGGLGVVCRDLAEALLQKNTQITFVLPKLPHNAVLPNFRVINLNQYALDNNLLSKININLSPYLSNNYFNNFKSLKKGFENEIYGMNLINEIENYSSLLKEAVKGIEYDIIHAHDWMTAKAGSSLKKITGKPLILHIHSTEYDRTANNPNPEILKYEESGLHEADLVIAVSNYTKKILMERYQVPESKIRVIYNAVNKSITTNNKPVKNRNSKTVLFLARLTVQKGADYLLRAAQKVLQKRKNVRFVIVGQGDQLENLIDLSFDLGISDNVVFTGALTHDEVDKAYKYADLFVMPSVSEPFGITSLEAIRNGTPVIISKQSGASEILKNCLKIDFWDIDQMAAKIIAILDNEVLSSTLASNGFHDLDNLTWLEQTEKIIQIYNSIIK